MIWNERIKELRKDRHLTLKDVADKLGVTEATAQRYESNAIKTIPYETIIKYAEIFYCSPAYIMGWEESVQDDLNLKRETEKMNQEQISRLIEYAKFLNQIKKENDQ